MLDRIYWIVPGHAVVFEVIEEVTLEAVRELIESIRKTIDEKETSGYVDVLLDVSRVTRYHSDTMNIRKLFGAVKRHEAVRWNIIVNPKPNPVVDFVIRTVTQLFKTQLAIVPTIDDAMSFIQSKSIAKRS